MGFNKGLLVGLLVVSVFFIVIGGLLLNTSDNYGITVDEQYQDTFNKYSETNDLVQDMESTIEGGSVNPDGLDASVYTNVVVAGKASRQSGALAVDLVEQTPTILGIDPLVLSVIASIIFLLAAFGFIGMIARKNP